MKRESGGESESASRSVSFLTEPGDVRRDDFDETRARGGGMKKNLHGSSSWSEGMARSASFVAFALVAFALAPAGTSLPVSLDDALRDAASRAARDARYVVDLRRELHRHPELQWAEHRTSAVVKRELRAMGVAHRDVAPPGVLATIGTGAAPAVLLRADMDGLPILEAADVPEHLRSEMHGKMHACGHDGHVAMLLGAAKHLAARFENDDDPTNAPGLLNGTVYLVFQPAEEGGAGAARMLDEGLARLDPPPAAAFAAHLWPYPETPSGVVGVVRDGAAMAGSAAFEITIEAAPSSFHTTDDDDTSTKKKLPRGTRMGSSSTNDGGLSREREDASAVACAASVAQNLQGVVARRVDPLESALITVSAVRAGAVPNTGSLEGDDTARGDRRKKTGAAGARLVGQFHATSPSVFGALFDWVRSAAVSAATSAGCAAPLVDFEPRLVGGVPRRHYPPTVNDARAAALALEVGRAMFGAADVRSPAPAMPGEDFGFFAARWPSAMAWVGAHNASAGAVWPLHSDKYVLDEGVLHRGVAMHVGFATAFLTRGGFREGGGA